MAAAPAFAADLTFTLYSATGSGSPTNLPPDADPPCLNPNCVLFSGTLTDNDTDLSLLFLENVSITFSASNPAAGFLSIDNTFTFDVAGVLSGDPAWATDNSGNPPNSYAGPIFGIDIAPGTPAGVYTGTVTIGAVGGTNDPGHSGFTVTQNFTVTVIPPAQTITFGALSNKVFGAAPFTLTATASSGLPVSFASTTPSVCTVAGTTVTIVGGGACSITATQPGNAAFAPAAPVTQSFTVNAASAGPTVMPGGVGPIYGSSISPTTIQPGSWVAIYGTNLANTTAQWIGNFPTSLGGIAVTIDGRNAYLAYASPTQINLQAPDDSTMGVVPVTVTNANGSWTSTVTLAPISPSFSELGGKYVAGIIPRSDGSGAYGDGTYDIIGPTGSSLGYPTVAAKAGDTVELFGVGFGPTNPPVFAGLAFSGAAPTTNTVQLKIGGSTVLPSFAGLSSAGLYQINVTIPAGLGTGDLPLVGLVGGLETQSGVFFPLQ